MVAGEVVGLEEEADAAAGLVADPLRLRRALGAGEEQPGAGFTGRGDEHPALAVAERRVLEQ